MGDLKILSGRLIVPLLDVAVTSTVGLPLQPDTSCLELTRVVVIKAAPVGLGLGVAKGYPHGIVFQGCSSHFLVIHEYMDIQCSGYGSLLWIDAHGHMAIDHDTVLACGLYGDMNPNPGEHRPIDPPAWPWWWSLVIGRMEEAISIWI